MADGGRGSTLRRACGGRKMGAGRCTPDDGRRELAGLPELDEVFEAGEDAREDGGDHGVQGGGQHSPGSPRRGCGAHLGAEIGEPGWVK